MDDSLTVPTPLRESPPSPPILRASYPNHSTQHGELQEPPIRHSAATLPARLGVHFASTTQGDTEVEQQPSLFEMAWPTVDNHLLLTIIMTTLVLLCGNWMSLVCTFIAMLLSCSALYDDITSTGHSRLPKAKISLLLNMAAIFLMAAVWHQILLPNEVSAGGRGGGGGGEGGGGKKPSCISAMFCTIRSCPFSAFGYSYRYHKPITHAACFCSDV